MTDPKIIYEDENFLAVDKPSGLMVHSAKIKTEKISATPTEPTLVDWLLKKYPEIATVGDDPAQRPGIVHRLDKGTSGVLLVAKNQKTFEYLKSLFQKHEIIKTYLALVHGEPARDAGVIDAPIGIKNGTTKRSIHSSKMAKEAITEWRVLKKSKTFSLLEVKPKTGRTHQIRVHLASISHAIVGDPLYGKKKSLKNSPPGDFPRLMLHALAIEFTAPSGKRMRIESEVPKSFKISTD